MRVASPFVPQSHVDYVGARGGGGAGKGDVGDESSVRMVSPPPTGASAFSDTHGFQSSFSPPSLRPSLQSQPHGSNLYSVLASTTGYTPLDKSTHRKQLQQSSSCAFVPVLTPNETTDLRAGAQSPYSKASPTPSMRTVTTLDSIESAGFSLASPAGTTGSWSNGTSGNTTPLASPSSFQPVWVPPKDVSLCQLIQSPSSSNASSSNNNKSNYASRRSPSSFEGSQSPSPIKKKQLFRNSNTSSDDPMRISRRKTELCMHYVNKTPCPFGTSCTYAHGEEELQLTKLMDLHRAGMADCATYRIKPCLTWVSTGSWYVYVFELLNLRASYIAGLLNSSP